MNSVKILLFEYLSVKYEKGILKKKGEKDGADAEKIYCGDRGYESI